MVKVEINKKVRRCDHCGTKNIQRSFRIYNSEREIYIGRVCLQRELGINTSGNPYRAAKRIEYWLNLFEDHQLEDEIWWLKND